MKVFTAPEQIPISNNIKIFLGGTIEMGDSFNWQNQFIDNIKKGMQGLRYPSNIHILNPRRVNWDSSWEQSFQAPEFFQQVSWEMDAMDKADIIVMNFLPESQSPISLLELGMYANSGKLRVCCPDEFYRSGNVQMVCNKFNIPLYKSMSELLSNLKLNQYEL